LAARALVTAGTGTHAAGLPIDLEQALAEAIVNAYGLK